MNIKKDADVRIGVLFYYAICFSIGRNNAKEAAISGVYFDCREASPTASEGKRLRALPARRKLPAGAPRPEGNGSGHCPLTTPPPLRGSPPLSGEASSKLSHWEKLPFRSRFSGVYCENWESFANRLRREKAAGTPRNYMIFVDHSSIFQTVSATSM